ncbi:MAG: tRNA epoxyqueuosine(34) reductase QueG [Candidatus Sumerlaeaceae bacterium]|jgi:epoxyqueuosine reductase
MASHSTLQAKEELRKLARELGFSDVRIARAGVPPESISRYRDWLAQSFHGQMRYMAESFPVRSDIDKFVPGARSVIVFRADYYPHEQPQQPIADGARVAKYAVGVDYHLILREKLTHVVDWLGGRFPGHSFRICVDSAPLLERAFAIAAGIGFLGKNTMVITPRSGSFYFLGSVVTTAELEPDPPRAGTCGTCTRCIDACPTGAIVAPYVLDARRCISYLTIEKRSELTEDEKTQLGNWIFGCDICQDVCPYNKQPPLTPFEQFRNGRIVSEYISPRVFLEPSSHRAFRRRFAASPLLRAGAKRLQALARWFVEQRGGDMSETHSLG